MKSEKKTVKIFLASSIDEFEVERLKLKNFINDLSRKLQKQGINIDLEPLACEEMSQVTSLIAQQDRINDLIKDSQFCFVLIGNEVGKYTLLEYDVAMKHFVDFGNPRVIVSIKKPQSGESPSQSVKDFVDYRYRNQKHYTNTFENVDSIKIIIILELLNSDLLADAKFSIQEGVASIGKSDLNDIVDVNTLPVYSKNEALNFNKEELKHLRVRKEEIQKKLAKQPSNNTLVKMLSEIDVSINELADEIHRIENDILDLLRRVLVIDRSQNISNRQIAAVEALEKGDYETAKAILSGDQWKEDLLEADRAINYSVQIKKEAEEAIAINKKNIEQEISTQRLRISLLKSMGVNDTTAREIQSIYETIVEYAIKYNLETDVIIEYAKFLADQEDYLNAIRIGQMLEENHPKDHLIVCQCYFLIGNMLRQRNDIEGTKKYSALLHSFSREKGVSDNIRSLAESESLVLKEKCESMGSSKLEKYAKDAINLLPQFSSSYPIDAFSIERDARYWLAIHLRELVEIPDSLQKKRYKKAIEAFSDFLPVLRNKAEINPEEYTKSLSMWLNSFANLYKKTQDIKLDDSGYIKAEPLRIEAYELLHDVYQNNHAKYARDYALACQTLGNLYRSLYRFEESKKYHEEALPIFRTLVGKDIDAHINDYVNECNNYVNLLRSIGEIEEADQIAYEGIKAYEEYGFEADDGFRIKKLECMAKLHNNLAFILIQKGERQEAIKQKKASDEYQRQYNEKLQKKVKKPLAIESVSFLKKYPNKISFDIDKASEIELKKALDGLIAQENGNQIERTALLNRRSLCLISEKLVTINERKYRSVFAYWCCLLGMLKSSCSMEERIVLHWNVCFICDEISMEDPDKYLYDLLDLYRNLNVFDENLFNERGIIIDTYIWNRYLLIDLYVRQLKQIDKTTKNLQTQEWNIGTEYSFIANKYLVLEDFDLAIIAAKQYREHMLTGQKTKSTGEIWLADACVKIAESYNSSPINDMSILSYLKEAESIVSRYANYDINACHIMYNCLENYAKAFAKNNDRDKFNYYSSRISDFIKNCPLIPFSSKRESLQNAQKNLNAMRINYLENAKVTVGPSKIKKEEQETRSSVIPGRNIHYRKVQKLKKQGLSIDEVVSKLELSYTTVKADWDD